jgi:hypothetical protein
MVISVADYNKSARHMSIIVILTIATFPYHGQRFLIQVKNHICSFFKISYLVLFRFHPSCHPFSESNTLLDRIG